jgi:hypothetical protein
VPVLPSAHRFVAAVPIDNNIDSHQTRAYLIVQVDFTFQGAVLSPSHGLLTLSRGCAVPDGGMDSFTKYATCLLSCATSDL